MHSSFPSGTFEGKIGRHIQTTSVIHSFWSLGYVVFLPRKIIIKLYFPLHFCMPKRVIPDLKTAFRIFPALASHNTCLPCTSRIGHKATNICKYRFFPKCLVLRANIFWFEYLHIAIPGWGGGGHFHTLLTRFQAHPIFLTKRIQGKVCQIVELNIT